MNAKPLDAPRSALDLDWLTADVGELRASYARAHAAALAPSDRWETIHAGDRDIAVLRHEPPAAVAPDCAILYFHGGGWIVGSPATHADLSNTLSDLCGLTCLSVDYRLAPEYPAPAPIEDGLAVLSHHLALPIEDGGIRSAILCGDSAGGTIAVAMERSASPALRKAIRGVVSFYGGFGAFDAPSVAKYGRREDGMDRACLERYWRLANGGRDDSPYSVAHLTEPGNVPVYLVAAELDPVAGGSILLAGALRSAGRGVTLELVSAQGHSFLQSVPLAQRRDLLADVTRWIKTGVPA